MREKEYLSVAVLGVFAAFACRNIYLWFGRLGNPDKHPIKNNLKGLGNPAALIIAIERETAVPGNIKAGYALVTRSFVLNRTPFSLQINTMDNIVWMYKLVTQRRTNFIPTGKTYSAVLRMRDKSIIDIPMKDKEVDGFLNDITKRRSGVLTGYSDELNSL